MLKSGDVILANIQFTDTFEIKKRPAVILFSSFNNIILAGITSNTEMQGIKITKKEGAIKESIIKTNYIFTISSGMVEKKLFTLSKMKQKEIYIDLTKKLKSLN